MQTCMQIRLKSELSLVNLQSILITDPNNREGFEQFLCIEGVGVEM